MSDKKIKTIAIPTGCHRRFMPFPTGGHERWQSLWTPVPQLMGMLHTSGWAYLQISHLVRGYSIYQECPDPHLILYTLEGQGSCQDRGRTFILKAWHGVYFHLGLPAGLQNAW